MGNPVFVFLVPLVVAGFAYLLIQKPKTATIFIVGLFSLIIMGLLLIPTSQSLGHLNGMSSFFAWMLLLCALGLLAVFVLSIISIVKMILIHIIDKGRAYKFLKKTFFFAIVFTSIAFIIVIFSTVIGDDYAKMLFGSYGDALNLFILGFILSSLLLLTWSFVGLFLLKKAQEVIPVEQQTTTSNRVGLSIVSLAISLVAMLPTGIMLYVSFVGYGRQTLSTIIQSFSDHSSSIILLSKVFVACSLVFIVVVLLNGVSTVMAGALRPEKAKKWLNITFFTTALTAAVTLICSIIRFDVIIKKTSIAELLDSFSMMEPFVFFLIVTLGLSILGFLSVRKSKTVNVAELNAIKAQKREAARKIPENKKPDVRTSIGANSDFVKQDTQNIQDPPGLPPDRQYTPDRQDSPDINDGFLQKIIEVYKCAFTKVKDILISPKTAWLSIESENLPNTKVFTSYILPLTVIAAIAAFIGWGFVGYSLPGYSGYSGYGYTPPRIHSVAYGFKMLMALSALLVGCVYVISLIINLLAKSFQSRDNFEKAFSLVAYSCTPIILGGIFHLIPNISWMWLIVSLYSFYLFYTGLQPMMQTPEEKKMPYSIAGVLSLITVFFILGWILTKIFGVPVFGNIAL